MILPDRPRLWITQDSLPALKAKAAAGDSRWLVLKQMMDTHMPPDWDRGVFSPCLCYLATGNADYAQVAIRLMFGDHHDGPVYGGIGAIQGDSGYVVRTLLPDAACLLDWAYPVLTPPQRADLIACLEQWARWVWPKTNASRAGAWGTSDGEAGNNYHSGFLLGTWTAALALSGDSALADPLLALSRRKFDGAVMPYWAGMGKGGMWPEDGTSYGVQSTRMLFLALEAHRTATGEDLLTANAWPSDALTVSLHTTTPDRAHRWCWGDQPNGSAAWLGDADRTAPLIGTRFDARMAPWLESSSPNRNQGRSALWEEVAFWNAPRPA